MKLYAVKCGEQYLRKREDSVERTTMNKASVFASLEDVLSLRDAYGSGKIAELILTENLLDL